MKSLLIEEKVQQITNICKEALTAQSVSAQDLSSIVGKLVVTRSAILPALILSANLKLNKESQREIQWWIHNLHE